MELVRLRERACRLGFVVEPHGSGWTVANSGTTKNLQEIECGDVLDVDAALRRLEGQPNPKFYYVAGRTADGVRAFVGTNNGQVPLRHVVRHSPTGFEMGYGGSGPADLALSILVDHFQRTGKSREAAVALAECVYQKFKLEFVAAADGALLMTSEDIEAWLTGHVDGQVFSLLGSMGPGA